MGSNPPTVSITLYKKPRQLHHPPVENIVYNLRTVSAGGALSFQYRRAAALNAARASSTERPAILPPAVIDGVILTFAIGTDRLGAALAGVEGGGGEGRLIGMGKSLMGSGIRAGCPSSSRRQRISASSSKIHLATHF
jgi:hypothetical protein